MQACKNIGQEISKHNDSLAEAAKIAGVIEPGDYAIFPIERRKFL